MGQQAGSESTNNGTTIFPVVVRPEVVPAGAAVKMCYTWKAVKPTETPYKAFVHIIDDQRRMVLQDDHVPPVGTSTPGWQGTITYERRVVIPAGTNDGQYRIVVGLYNESGRAPLTAGQGAPPLGDNSYQTGALKIDSQAPWPSADTDQAPSLDLSAFHLTFSEEFDGPLDVSAWGSGTRWIAHTPWAGDFGDARFADPGSDFPFTVKDGILCIEARKDKTGKWSSGLLASNDPPGNGFSQQYGYFEMRAKLPPGPGVWPAFWLCSSYNRKDKTAGLDGSVEIDVLEYYGRTPCSFTTTVHVWLPKPHRSKGFTVTTKPYEVSSGFHSYGCMVDPQWITMYFDGIKVWKSKTPLEHNKPLMLLLNFALGPGWPIDKTPNPSVMEVDYVRVYARAENKLLSCAGHDRPMPDTAAERSDIH
ncbi:MAG: glycoside hydrolase family 16 protein [Sedimentisphaerales bacterium]|nr:glycoside hydrolase family 16 protein [Sedimentisphaerales bacterium]